MFFYHGDYLMSIEHREAEKENPYPVFAR